MCLSPLEISWHLATPRLGLGRQPWQLGHLAQSVATQSRRPQGLAPVGAAGSAAGWEASIPSRPLHAA